MRAILLAAGRGNRMGSLTKEKPKCLIELDGKPLIEWQIKALKEGGIDKIGIVVGYKKEKINYPELTFFENVNWEKTNMVSSLLCADKWLSKYDCIVSYSDILYPSGTVTKLTKSKGDIVVSYNTEWLKVWQERFGNPLIDAETFILNEEGSLLEIGGKATDLSQIQGQYMGLIKLTPMGWEQILDFFLSSQEMKIIDKLDITSLLNKLIISGIKINTIPINGNWFEIDNKRDLELCITYKHLLG